jgi:tRNA A-37 threonylcarbamoyl transferase component Bud32
MPILACYVTRSFQIHPLRMPVNIDELSAQTDALRKDYTFLGMFGVDASKVQDRSQVTQHSFTENGFEVHTFVKVYSYRKSFLQRLWRKGTARLETRNLLFFRNIGIHTPRVIAWGQRKNLIGKIVDEYIITEAVPNTQTLDAYMAAHCPDRSKTIYRRRRDSIIHQLSHATRTIHAHHFYHQDLKWRNVLSRNKGDEAELFWIDCPKGDFTSSANHQIRRGLKDCATLDKLARMHCTKEERLRFVAGYLGQSLDSPEVAAQAASIADYRRKRFDAEDERQALKKEAKANAAQSK